MNQHWELTRGDALYPTALEDLPDPPQRLYGLGNPEVLSERSLSIIGARKATPYGLAAASLGGRVAAECDVVVVSGGAMGCDAAASRAALDAGGKTVVVSGCGADVVYPRSSSDVYERAVKTGGAVVSLQPWGAQPQRWAFPKRNRIIAALSQSVLICEAGVRSGTFSTALAADQIGRDLYVIPGSIFSAESAGANQLIVDGAYIIASEVDLEQRIAFDYGVLRMLRDGDTRPEGRILSSLISEPMRADDLARHLGEPVHRTLSALADYEARGVVMRLPDGRFSLSEAAYSAHGRMLVRHGAELSSREI